ncbi:hypothetical protein RAHE111665_12065 [Rariglobus hedericola]
MGSEDNALLNEVARSARFGADKRAIAANEPVEEAALACVGLADNYGFDAIAQEFAVVMGGQKAGCSM